MRTREELEQHIKQYPGAKTIYIEDIGYVVWAFGAGGNIEILFFASAEPRRGYGTRVFKAMIDEIERTGDVPYHSIYVITQRDNHPARRFYESLGFKGHDCGDSLFQSGGAVLFALPYEGVDG